MRRRFEGHHLTTFNVMLKNNFAQNLTALTLSLLRTARVALEVLALFARLKELLGQQIREHSKCTQLSDNTSNNS